MSEERGDAETEELELEEAEEAENDEGILDDGEEGDEGHAGAGDGEEGQAQEDVAQPQRKPPSRGSRAIAQLRERSQRAEREAAELRGRLQALEGRQSYDPGAAAAAAAAERAELERVASLPYEDQIRFHNQRTEQRVSSALQRQEFLITDRLDKQGFDALARQDPIAARLKDQVEQVRMANPAIPREAILNHLYGQEMRARAARATEKQRRAGQRRIAQQTTQPGQVRGNAAAGRRNTDDSIEAVKARLRGVSF